MSVLCSFRALRRLPSSGPHGALLGPVCSGAAPHSGIILYVLLKSSLGCSPLASLLICNVLYLSCSRASVLLIPSAGDTCPWLSLRAAFLPHPGRSRRLPSLHGVRISTPRVVRGCALCSSCLVFLLNYCKNTFLFVHEGRNFVLFSLS